MRGSLISEAEVDERATPSGPIALVDAQASASTTACPATGSREKRAMIESGTRRAGTAADADHDRRSTPTVTSGDGSPQP